MPNSENYTLIVNKYSEETGTTENHTYSAPNPEELKKLLQLAGIAPATFDDTSSCGCGGHEELPQPEVAPEAPEFYDLPYDYGDNFTPHYGMPDWQAQSYEKFTTTPAEQWPQVFEELAEELMGKGLTREEANDKILEVMSLDLNENWDYGHRTMPEIQVHQHNGETIDKSAYRHFKQHYIQARYGDNPLEFGDVTELTEKAKTVVDLYNDFLSEATNSYTTPVNSKGEKLSLNKKKDEAGEFVVRMYKNGKLYEPGCYYTDDWDDAVGTFHSMKKRLDESGIKRYAESIMDEYIAKATQEGFMVNPEEIHSVMKTDKGFLVMGEMPESEIYYVTRFEENEGGWDYAGNPEFETQSYDEALDYLDSASSKVLPPSAHGDAKGTIHLRKTQESDKGSMTEASPKLKKVVLGKFVKNPELEITAIPVRDKVTGQPDYKVSIVDKFDNNNKQVVLLRGAGSDFSKMIEQLKSTNGAKFEKAGGVKWDLLSVSESGQRLDPKCWPGYKKGNPKTKISPQTGKRVNNCVKK